MAPIIERIGPAFAYSLFRYVTEQTYTVGMVTGKLTDHHTGLKIRAAYPDDILAITGPTLAVVGGLSMMASEIFFGDALREDEVPLSIYGFVAGQGASPELRDAANRIYRDALFNDVYNLLSGHASDAGFVLYSYPDKVAIGAVELYDVLGRILPVNAPDIEADRYRFMVEGMACLS